MSFLKLRFWWSPISPRSSSSPSAATPPFHNSLSFLFMRFVVISTLLGAFGALAIMHNFKALRRQWERMKPMGPHVFLPSSLDPSTHFLSPVHPQCSSWWRSDYLPFLECSPHLLSAAASTWQPGQVPRSDMSFPLGRAGGAREGSSQLSSQVESSVVMHRGNESTKVEWISHVTTCNFGTNRFARTVTDTGIQLTILGLGTFWKSRWGYRMRLLHDHLVNVERENPDRIIIFSDGEDVIPVPATSAEKVLERYHHLVERYQGPQVFFAAETVCYPKPQLWESFQAPDAIPGGKGWSPFRYLNAGVMVGPAKFIRRMLELTYQGDCSDDQYLYTLAHLDPLVWWLDPSSGLVQVASTQQSPRDSVAPDAKPLIGLDHWNELILAMYGIGAEQYSVEDEGKRLHLGVTGSTPLILHQNGDKRESSMLEVLSRKFGYESACDPAFMGGRHLHCIP